LSNKSGDPKPFPLVATNFVDVTPSFSPDGKWLAYANDESGHFEVYIQPFPSGTGRWQVSTAGGGRPSWRKDSKELYFLSIDSNSRQWTSGRVAPAYNWAHPTPSSKPLPWQVRWEPILIPLTARNS
jgi:Tol biopolymer transport system component